MSTPIPLPPRDQRERLTIDRDEALDLLEGSTDTYEVISDEVIDTTRWSIINHLVIERVRDGRFFADSYSVGATECQDESPWQDTAPDFREVFPVEVTVVEYK